MAVDVEDASAKQIAENGRELFPFRVIVEPGSQDVLDIIGIGGDDVVGNVDVYGSGRRFLEKMGVPIGDIVEFLRPGTGEEILTDLAFAFSGQD